MIYVVNSYVGYEHSGESKLLSPHETLEQAHLLEPEGVLGIVPFEGKDQIGPITDIDKDNSEEGFVAEVTQAGVLVDPDTGKANVVAFTLDIAGEDDSGQIYFSDSDKLRISEEVTLDPTNNDSSTAEASNSDTAPENVASIAGIALPASKKLLVVQMIPESS
jgi:hypothetical protein